MIKPLFPLFASLTLGVVANGASAQASPAALSLQVYNADAGSFHVNAVLVSGKTDAVLIDTGFTRADALSDRRDGSRQPQDAEDHLHQPGRPGLLLRRGCSQDVVSRMRR